jgi:hypothetical protein
MTGGVTPGFHPGASGMYNTNGVGRGMAPPGTHQPGQQPPGYPNGPLSSGFQPPQQGVTNMSLVCFPILPLVLAIVNSDHVD